MLNEAIALQYFGISLEVADMSVEVRVNDIPVFYESNAGKTSVEIATPENIVDGENTLSVYIFPPYLPDEDERMDVFPAHANVKATLYHQDSPSARYELATITAQLSAQGDLQVEGERATLHPLNDRTMHYRAITRFSIDSPFPRWAWQEGMYIDASQENFNSLLQAYKQIHHALKEKDEESIRSLYSLRAQEITAAYQLDGIEEGYVKLSVGKDMMDERLTLYDMFLENMEIEVLAKGKMARIVDYDKDQPIYFYEEDAGLLHLHRFLFYLDKNKGWIMIR